MVWKIVVVVEAVIILALLAGPRPPIETVYFQCNGKVWRLR